ncbi:MAG: DUF3100 domain-containing protein [Cellulosilyticaceae bacterium]
MENLTYRSTTERFQKEYKIYLISFVMLIIADAIGQIKIPIGPGQLILFPIFYALILGILQGPHVLKIFKEREVKAASKLVIFAICPFVAKLGISAGANLPQVLSAGPALLFQELGNLCTIFLALPIALLLGLKREAIGAVHSINRETNLALISNVYGPDSDEMRGSLSIYVIGGMIGTIYFGFLATLCAATNLFHPYALGMASGVGAGIMMASATASLTEIYPAYADQIVALAGVSETISGVTGIYVGLFIALPLCTKLYNALEPKIGRLHARIKSSKTQKENTLCD